MGATSLESLAWIFPFASKGARYVTTRACPSFEHFLRAHELSWPIYGTRSPPSLVLSLGSKRVVGTWMPSFAWAELEWGQRGSRRIIMIIIIIILPEYRAKTSYSFGAGKNILKCINTRWK